MSKDWIKGIDYPDWAGEDYITTLKGGYLQEDETPKQAYIRLAETAYKHLKNLPILNIREKIFEIMWKGWLIPSTPVMSNMGTNKGSVISCFGSDIEDSISSIWEKAAEVAMMSKIGGGTSINVSNIRAIGSEIRGGKGGVSSGVLPFLKVFDATVNAAKQSNLRRGACAAYMDINHKEARGFMNINKATSGENHCNHLFTGFNITDFFMKSLEKNPENKSLFKDTIKTRIERGYPYYFFIDTANKKRGKHWNTELSIKNSNLCTEICEPSDFEHSFVCCLSSTNIFKYDEWKDTDMIFIATLFLDAVMSEFIIFSENILELRTAKNFAVKARALGLGSLGLASYLQTKMIAYDELTAQLTCRKIYSQIRDQSELASNYMGQYLGVPEWCKGSSRRNLTTTAIAPNRTSTDMANVFSQSTYPVIGNYYADQTAKGTYYKKNPVLLDYLEEIGYNHEEIWESIFEHKGSVQHFDFLSTEVKKVFKTAFEINQMGLVRLIGVIQEYIEQGISCNLYFDTDAPPKYIYETHVLAWEVGLKSLYYLKSESAISVDAINKGAINDLYDGCVSCEG